MNNNYSFEKNKKSYQKKKKKRFFKKLNKYSKLILKFVSIFSVGTGISIVGAVKILSKKIEEVDFNQTSIFWSTISPLIDFVMDNSLLIFSFLFIFALVCYACIIPRRQIEEGKPPQEAKSSILVNVFLFSGACFFSTLSFLCVMYAKDLPDDIDQTTSEEYVEEICTDELSITEEEKIENYIIRCNTEVVSINELNDLSQDELYYIRNGIFAYSGRIFIEDELTKYYKQFIWYEAKYTSTGIWEYINSYQYQNIINIRDIEGKKGYY